MTTSKLEDFFTDDINSTPHKMVLYRHARPTDAYLLITGYDANAIAKPRLERQKAYARAVESVKSIKDEGKREDALQELMEPINQPLAMALISGWSFSKKPTDANKLKLLQQNKGLSDLVIGNSATEENYYAKK